MSDIAIKNIILPNKPFSNFELEDAAKRLKIPSFRGVFVRNDLPRKCRKKECGILNLDDASGPGTHWVAWYKDGDRKNYFDSYGIRPPIEIRDYLIDRYFTIRTNYNEPIKYFAVIYVCSF